VNFSLKPHVAITNPCMAHVSGQTQVSYGLVLLWCSPCQ